MAVVKIRGVLGANRELRETLKMLHLARSNNAVLVDDRPSFLGMLKEAQNYVTWGEPSKETLTLLLTKRGRLLGNKKITEEHLQKLGFKSAEEFAEAVLSGRVQYWKLREMQHVFRLHPPSKGFKGSIKKSYVSGGELGYRGDAINELMKRML